MSQIEKFKLCFIPYYVLVPCTSSLTYKDALTIAHRTTKDPKKTNKIFIKKKRAFLRFLYYSRIKETSKDLQSFFSFFFLSNISVDGINGEKQISYCVSELFI